MLFKLIISLALLAHAETSQALQTKDTFLNRSDIISTEKARTIVNRVWSQCRDDMAFPTPIQKLTSRFKNLFTTPEQPDEKSSLQQAYLMWMSGRTHGFDLNPAQLGDIDAMISTRDIIVHNIAKAIITMPGGSLPTTARAINVMWNQNLPHNNETYKLTKQSDTHLRQAMYTAFCQEWLNHWNFSSIDIACIPKELNSIETINIQSQSYIMSCFPKEFEEMRAQEVKARQLAEDANRKLQLQLEKMREQEAQARELAKEASKKHQFQLEAARLLEREIEQALLENQIEEAKTRQSLYDEFNARLDELTKQREQVAELLGVLGTPEHRSPLTTKTPSPTPPFSKPSSPPNAQANKKGSSENVSSPPDSSSTSFEKLGADGGVKAVEPSCSLFFRALMQSPNDPMALNNLTPLPEGGGTLPPKSNSSWDLMSPLAPPA